MEYEYMRALRQRFFVEPNVMTQREIEKGWRRLSERVDKEDQKRILGSNEQSHLFALLSEIRNDNGLGGGARASLRAPSPQGLRGAGAGRLDRYQRR